ncbi:hypothetical protein [Chryseobacterium piperi]|nr:hypothetical protein [Chryseobacterium piperi]
MKIFVTIILMMASLSVSAITKDTITITPSALNIKKIKLGKATYVVYNKKTKESPSEKIMLVKINVEPLKHSGSDAFAITQQWDLDTITHTAYTLLKTNDLSTLQHHFYWKRLGYYVKYDFETRKVVFDGKVADQIKTKAIEDFNASFKQYNLNWHSDLVIFPLLPYAKNRTFKITFFDPGFGQAKDVFYTVKGSDKLINSAGAEVDCWLLEHGLSVPGYQKFWISKKTNEVLKEEDLFNGSYRYKLKLNVSED